MRKRKKIICIYIFLRVGKKEHCLAAGLLFPFFLLYELLPATIGVHLKHDKCEMWTMTHRGEVVGAFVFVLFCNAREITSEWNRGAITSLADGGNDNGNCLHMFNF